MRTDVMKTQALRQALDLHRVGAAIGGARRDEERSRAKERVFSFRSPQHRWDPKQQRPEFWNLYNGRIHARESVRVFPLSNWTELDVWHYIQREDIPVPALYFAAERPVVERDGTLVMVDDERLPVQRGEVRMRRVRFRTLGCYPLTGAVESDADTLGKVIAEMQAATTSERQGRLIDHDAGASMEHKKQEGYFADCPGHEQYTRNMATGASTARLAVVLVDARKGVSTQTRRHSWIVSLLGIDQVVLAVNKMDLVGYDPAVFGSIVEEYRALAAHLGIERVDSAVAGQAVMLALEDEIDVSRGDVLASASRPPEACDQFGAHLLWMDAQPLLPGRPYWMQIGTACMGARVSEIKHQVEVNTQEHIAAKRLELNAVAAANLDLDQPVVFEPYAHCRELGGFVLIDRQTNATVAAGVIDFALRRATNIHWQALDVDKATRARIKGQVPRCAWFTGLSGSGKSTIANLVERKLLARGHHTYLLDGDNVRHGLNRDLGFSDEDRVENIRRVGEVSRLMVDAGLVVLVSFISPFRAERRMVRERFAPGEFIEVFVDTPLQECERRDAKGLYAKARRGELPNFTGIGSPYEVPENADLRLDTMAETAEALADAVVERLLAPCAGVAGLATPRPPRAATE